MTDLDRVTRIGNGCSDQCFFKRPADPLAVARADIPGGWRNDLVVFNLAVAHFDPV